MPGTFQPMLLSPQPHLAALLNCSGGTITTSGPNRNPHVHEQRHAGLHRQRCGELSRRRRWRLPVAVVHPAEVVALAVFSLGQRVLSQGRS